jgi:CMP-N-acetylneuraminic acid synthetase
MSSTVNILVIIPARAGSKRIKGKNLKPFNGTPLIEHSIKYAQNYIDSDIVISTNDKLITPVAKKYNVPILWRDEELSDDKTPTSEVIKAVVNELKKSYDYVVLLQATNPLRPKNLFKKAWDLLQEKQGDSLLTVSLNTHKMGKVNNSIFEPFTYKFGQRSQDLEPLYYENGLLYICSHSLAKSGSIIGKSPIAMSVDHPYGSVDIDTELDWKWAELISKEYND